MTPKTYKTQYGKITVNSQLHSELNSLAKILYSLTGNTVKDGFDSQKVTIQLKKCSMLLH